MLRFATYGFSKRVDDTVTRAMTILLNRPDYTAKPEERGLLISDPKPNRHPPEA